MSKRRKLPRRRALQARAQFTVEVIVEAAAQVLLQEGYRRTTTNRIAERAGVSIGSLYQYFRDKDDVLAALAQRQSELILDRITGVEPDPGRPLNEVLESLLQAAVQLGPDCPELLRRLAQIPGSGMDQAIVEGRTELTRFVRDLLSRYQDQLRVSDLDLAAYLIVSTAGGAGRNAPPERFNEQLAREVSTILTRYLVGAQ